MIIAVGMSGGVDSAVAAAILRDQGHEVIGLTMQVWDDSIQLAAHLRSSCFGPDEAQDLEAARETAATLGIRHHAVTLAREYREHVLDYFRREYLAGRTPNPCVQCNHAVKFGALLTAARGAGVEFDIFATGHYARVTRKPETGRHVLLRALDKEKDQSYFLSRLTQEQLAIALFPLGEWNKQSVREKARHFGFGQLADQPESQDFVACGDYPVLFEGMNIAPGPIVDMQGKVLGTHKGIVRYTIGQRKGLDLGGHVEPYYVIAIDVKSNTLIVGTHDDLMSPGLMATGVNWIAIERLEMPVSATVRIRRQAVATPALISPVESGPPTAVKVIFTNPQAAVTPGQAAVFYQDDIVLGGGWIERSLCREDLL